MAHILVVEDEPTVLLLAEGIIAELGHTTLSAANATQALALLNDPSLQIDLLFTDINIGDTDLDGWKLAKTALEARPQLRVVYTTGQPVTDGMQALFVDGAETLRP